MYDIHHVMDSMSPINAPEVRAIRKWFFAALVVSLVLHAFLYVYFVHKKIDHFNSTAPVERLVPPPFTVKKVTISEELFKPAATPDLKKPEPPKTIVQNDKPTVETLPADVRLTPNAPPSAGTDLAKTIAAEKPRVDPANIPRPEANAQVEREIDSMRDQVAPKNAPKIAPGKGGGMPNSMNDVGTPGYSNIDNLLAQSGPLTGSVAPLKMQDLPGGALFEYDSAKLSSSTVEMLRKIGTLIGRNPRSTFSIEGHTDSFGDAKYNLKLSSARAEAVKAWLVSNMKLNPSKIHTKGFGSSHLIKPATGSREEQAPNRRVEIVITTPKD